MRKGYHHAKPSSSMKKARMLYFYNAPKHRVVSMIGARRYKQLVSHYQVIIGRSDVVLADGTIIDIKTTRTHRVSLHNS